ncbi:PIN-like domain-containing protein [Vagococcus lutrae]|uniref:PIN-like domain-containing protein n=1 Tax=Vagococcus lutrae TaxID=81947 RepID=UPI00200FF237|nr:PIN-like domain-containing protein [Vagococcus lutrae]MDT2816268.1 PIN-like domain-containing protein [Vagococcus lutrae]MDT2824108.1 PIN-like domain-containing protein [Vagococcus lutrae]UQF19326.1 PIN-like domain-containing protein [Vagococcus lutrae]
MGTLKEEFPEFFQEKLSKSDLIRNDSLIIVDTNFLLDILRLPTKMAGSYINALEQAKNKLYIPYLVALEFNFSKSKIKKKRDLEIKKYKDSLEKNLNKLEKEIDFKSLIFDEESKNSYNKEILSLIKDFKISFDTLIEKQIEEHILKDYQKNYDGLINIINDKIGKKYTQDWIEKIEKDGEKRYKQSLPPGFDDQKKEENQTESHYRHYSNLKYNLKFGDLIIWKDILKYCQEDKENKIKNVIFVTNDNKSSKKSDIIYKVDGWTVGPHIYLMNELKMEADKNLYILNNLQFVKLSNDLTEEEVKSFENLDYINKNGYEKKFKYYKIPGGLVKKRSLNNSSDEKKYYWKLKDDVLEQMDELEKEEFLNRINKNSDKTFGLTPEGYLYATSFEEI